MGSKNQKVVEKMKQIVVPELKRLYKKLSDDSILQNEKMCKINGLPIHKDKKEKMVEDLVALEEYKIKKLLKERLNAEQNQDEFEGENKDYVMTQMINNALRKPVSSLDIEIPEAVKVYSEA
jgi:hypothetical protein